MRQIKNDKIFEQIGKLTKIRNDYSYIQAGYCEDDCGENCGTNQD